MKIRQGDIAFRYTRGQGSGGQHKNKTDSCVYAKHIPTDIEVKVDGRNQHQNKRAAIRELQKRVDEQNESIRSKQRKTRRDEAIHNETRIRTYDFSRGVVTDHRSGKAASIKDILEKGRIEKLR